MLVEKSRTVEVTAEVTNETHAYGVRYKLNGNELVSLHCDVSKKVPEEVDTPGGKQTVNPVERIGIMFKESGNKQISLRENEDIAPHVVVFEQILAEVVTSLAPAPVKASK